MPREKILFLIGSPNQTTQMHKISLHLKEFDCFFSQIFDDDPVVQWGVKRGWLEHTVLSGEFKRKADEYLRMHGLRNDFEGREFRGEYKLIVCCSDMIIPRCFKNHKKIWVQEGMIDKISWRSVIVKKLRLYRWMTLDTSLNGSSNICDIYCAASEGYKAFFTAMGTRAEKLIVTGMPNHDNIADYAKLTFPYRNFVLAATSDIRECYGLDDRISFIRKCVRIANGRVLIFKLHPNEKMNRAKQEIARHAPKAIIFEEGNINNMIVHCDELITQYSTVVYTGLVLGKKVHSYFSEQYLLQMAPLQNGGRSAETIANICQNYISFHGAGPDFLEKYKTSGAVSKEHAFVSKERITITKEILNTVNL
jgi:hypothetical protein